MSPTSRRARARLASIRPGDRVASADPGTARPAGARTVTAVLVHTDEDLLDLTIRDHAGYTTVVHTTARHPFYDVTAHAWIPAANLHSGDHLQGLGTRKTIVRAVTLRTGHRVMYNLTVAETHTYYIHAAVDILVHNQCSPGVPPIHEGKQGKHIVGHNNYAPGRSELTADPDVLAERAGTGSPANSVRPGDPGYKERIDYGTEIGTHVDSDGNRAPTSVGIIHYGKDGIHIVPGAPSV